MTSQFAALEIDFEEFAVLSAVVAQVAVAFGFWVVQFVRKCFDETENTAEEALS